MASRRHQCWLINHTRASIIDFSCSDSRIVKGWAQGSSSISLLTSYALSCRCEMNTGDLREVEWHGRPCCSLTHVHLTMAQRRRVEHSRHTSRFSLATLEIEARSEDTCYGPECGRESVRKSGRLVAEWIPVEYCMLPYHITVSWHQRDICQSRRVRTGLATRAIRMVNLRVLIRRMR